MTSATHRARLELDAAAIPRWTTGVALAVLCLASLWLRTRALNAGFWIDEGISVGIAHHPLTAIPHLLREDGSPPLYYLLLHAWIGWFGDGERATHTLSLLPALACIPVAYWLGSMLFGRTAGWMCAILAAVDPYLTYYAQEARMYTLAALFSLLATGAFVRGVVEGRRGWLPLLVVSLALLLYTHNWGLFFCAGLAVATAVYARAHWREALLSAVAVAVLYAVWVPTLLYQAHHTGAPWAMRPGVHALVFAPASVFTTDVTFGVLAAVAGIGIARNWDAVVPKALLLAGGSTIAIAWLESQVQSSWTSRYFAVLLGPLLLVAGAGLAWAGRLGLVTLTLVVFIWTGYTVRDDKSNVRAIAHGAAAYLHYGDVVLATHPEQVPALRYYLGPGYRYATQLGPVADTRVMDWRDALTRIDVATPQRDLAPVLASVRPGQRLVVVSPVFRDYRAWEAPWTGRVFHTSETWTRLVSRDPRFKRVATVQTDEIGLRRNYWKPLQAVVYVRRR